MWFNVVALALGLGFAASGLWMRRNSTALLRRLEGSSSHDYLDWALRIVPVVLILYGAVVAAVAAVAMF